jgi:hypothetical protein
LKRVYWITITVGTTLKTLLEFTDWAFCDKKKPAGRSWMSDAWRLRRLPRSNQGAEVFFQHVQYFPAIDLLLF